MKKETKKKNGDLLKPSESKEQILFIQFLKRKYPDVWVFAIPNGGQRHKATAVKLKAEGVARGVPDLMIPSVALFIEMKTKGGRLSEPQKIWAEYLAGHGYTVLTCWSFEDAKTQFIDYMESYGGRMIY